jgi:hypothetical protein
MDTALEIPLTNGEYRIDSRLVARALGIEHKHLLETVRTYQSKIQMLGILPFETAKFKSGRDRVRLGLPNTLC